MDKNSDINTSKLSSKLNNDTLNSTSFGTRVLFLRSKLGVSQDFLATKVGVSGNTIQSYEKDNLPKGINAIELARFFGVSLDWLLMGEDPMYRNEVAKQPHEQPEQGVPCARCERLEADNRELMTENRELNKENRELMRENGDLRVELAETRTISRQSDEASRKAS